MDGMLECILSDEEGQRNGDEKASVHSRVQAKVVIEALRGARTIQEIAAKHQVHSSRVSGWKRQA